MMNLKSTLIYSPKFFDFAKYILRKLGNTTELYLLLDAFFAENGDYTFIQIGANDGISYDPFREFILRKGMYGVLVEPLPFLFEKLKQNYRGKKHVLVNCAISYNTHALDLFTVTEAFLKLSPTANALSGVASFSKDHVVKHIGLANERYIQKLNVPCKTVESIQTEYGFQTFDCIFMDIEGYEAEVICSMSFEKVKPKLIVYENTHLGVKRQEIETLLANKGFQLYHFVQDTVAILR